MKRNLYGLIAITMITMIALTACSTAATQTSGRPSALAVSATAASAATSPAGTVFPTVDPEAQVRSLVENFGKKLQDVALLAPDASLEIQQQYAEFVAPDLLNAWMQDVMKAPGRLVSSPWPDHIAIISLSRINADSYEVRGAIVELTSAEVASGAAADEIPVSIVVQKSLDGWLITDFVERP